MINFLRNQAYYTNAVHRSGILVVPEYCFTENRMKRKEFEGFLSKLETFGKPKLALEQYSTGVELAGGLFISFTWLVTVLEKCCYVGHTACFIGASVKSNIFIFRSDTKRGTWCWIDWRLYHCWFWLRMRDICFRCSKAWRKVKSLVV